MLLKDFAKIERGPREELKLSLFDFFFCFRVLFLVFLDLLLRFRV